MDLISQVKMADVMMKFLRGDMTRITPYPFTAGKPSFLPDGDPRLPRSTPERLLPASPAQRRRAVPWEACGLRQPRAVHCRPAAYDVFVFQDGRRHGGRSGGGGGPSVRDRQGRLLFSGEAAAFVPQSAHGGSRGAPFADHDERRQLQRGGQRDGARLGAGVLFFRLLLHARRAFLLQQHEFLSAGRHCLPRHGEKPHGVSHAAPV